MATKEQEAFEAYFRATWPEPSDGIMYCRPQMERDFKAGWDAAQAPLLEIMQEASDFLKSIEGAGYGGISRYDVLCVRLEEAMKGSTGKPPMLEAMKVTIDQIEGRPHTVVWHGERISRYHRAELFGGGYAYFEACGELVLDNHVATALPPLPRKPKPEHAKLLHLYAAHGLRIFGTYIDLPAIDGQSNRCEYLPITGMVYCDYEERQGDDAMLECDNIEFDFTITHAMHNGKRLEIAIEGAE